MLEIIKEYSTLIIIAATLLNIWFVYKNWEMNKSANDAKNPVIDFVINNLPEYTEAADKTSITLKNVGTRATGKEPDVTITCSWMANMSYKLNFPSDNYNLEPNETMTWKIRLDNNPPANSSVIVRVYSNGCTWEHHEQIS